MFSVPEIARLYRVTIGDMGEDTPTLDVAAPPRRGVLLCGGAGLMMTTLDLHPIRYFLDADTYHKGPDVRLPDSMLMWARYHAPLVVMGWYTTRVPAPILEGVRAVEEGPDAAAMTVYSGGGLNRIARCQWEDLTAFYAHLGRRLSG